ncbi:polyphosphate kinase 1 [Oribacterium sp. oral taxon 102]|uniref:polyphosphate kinase 1 n=1 Tax=Oribacterium sp. oral taxon 102 TaxID=671214 RepID=UPI0015BD9F72|nr:polyphosphate kinase 1 [Oribacterium sp. oral taxon 102]NWO22153.1 polyphosphate kinase 1 [Oribacterium sp. oral taxon 102]
MGKGEKTESYFKNRELSWLQFNERVLNEAGNPRVPLGERLSFASIYQTNLDEFFMVRVGTLMVQMQSREKVRENKTGLTAAEQVKRIVKQVKRLEKKKRLIYEQLMGELEPEHLHLINFQKLSKTEQVQLEQYFDRAIRPYLSPMLVGRQQPFPFLQNRELYAVVLLGTKSGNRKIGVVPCSNPVFKRLIEIPGRRGYLMLSEELILHFVSKLYPQYQILEKSIVRVTRNADIDANDIYDEDLDYRGIMEQLLKKRSRLNPVRLELSRDMNKAVRKKIAEYLDIPESHIIRSETPLELSFVFQLQSYLRERPALFYQKRSPRYSAMLNRSESVLSQVERQDVLLSYPYESMRGFLTLLKDAAEDPQVESIKITLYRVANHSQIVDVLCDAAENGKQVLVLVELRARFDEANNIDMSRRLEDSGCQIIYGLGEYKVHSKLCLITKRGEKGILRYITQIGTGNYNEKTALLYTDLCLMTANQEIGRDAAEVFRCLMLGETVRDVGLLLVAPNCLQNRILELIEREIRKAAAGRPAYIGIKINSLTDKAIIQKLAEASRAGVRIEMIVRGICCLIPGIPGETEHIRIVSIVGRYLEHARIYRFGIGTEEKIYISSADFMTRNTLRRVEVAAPILEERLKERIRHIFELEMRDDEKGKELAEDGMYYDRALHAEGNRVNSQEILYQEAYGSAESK